MEEETKATAWVTISPAGLIIGTANHFKRGEYFEVTGTRGNKWLFKIDDVLELGEKLKNEKNVEYFKHIEHDIDSEVGLCVAFPLAHLINDIVDELGDDAVVKLHRGSNNPDDTKKD